MNPAWSWHEDLASAIVARCDQYHASLPPISIYVLRLRYNSTELLLPRAVGQLLKMSDARGRSLEARARQELDDCERMSCANLPVIPIRFGRPFQQPTACLLCAGASNWALTS
jgi:hypothetical protein